MWIILQLLSFFFSHLSVYKVHTYQKYHTASTSLAPSVFDVFTVQITARDKENGNKKKNNSGSLI